MKKKTSGRAVRVDAALRARSPLITAAGARTLHALCEHPHAPRWNHAAGDRLQRADLDAVRKFADDLEARRGPRGPAPAPAILRWTASLAPRVPTFRDRIPAGFDLEAGWDAIPTMSREDVATRAGRLVPDDADLSRMIVYRTAGTTGHALLVPHDPRAAACYSPMLEFALRRHGLRPRFTDRMVACFLVGAQARTVTYPTVLSAWNGAGFAKLNLTAADWKAAGSPDRYFADLAPWFLTGDPVSFAEMLRTGIRHSPAALVTTAVAMSASLKKRLAKSCRCPVIDWYSLTETGPLGYACPRGRGYHVLPHDVHLEALDAAGRPVAPGARGEIAVTGGRNPFLPLLRYRTGDWGRLDFGRCPCGDPMPRLLDLEGRAPVVFRATGGSAVNPVDLSRVLREFPFVQHEFVQRRDLSCELTARPIPGVPRPMPAEVRAALRALLGPRAAVAVKFDAKLGSRAEGGKVEPYRSELLLED
ncbi:MAG: phenylacetate--CoA ligase family protein [Planctomycetes bacterium]|nr:phenylacetate--CoA ligase family protein [Planctomycetota bacterium]